MSRQVHKVAVAATVLFLSAGTPTAVRAQTDVPPSPDVYAPVAQGQIFVPGSNPAQSVPGYAGAPATPFSTAQPSTGYPVPPAYMTQQNYGQQPTYTNTQAPS